MSRRESSQSPLVLCLSSKKLTSSNDQARQSSVWPHKFKYGGRQEDKSSTSTALRLQQWALCTQELCRCLLLLWRLHLPRPVMMVGSSNEEAVHLHLHLCQQLQWRHDGHVSAVFRDLMRPFWQFDHRTSCQTPSKSFPSAQKRVVNLTEAPEAHHPGLCSKQHQHILWNVCSCCRFGTFLVFWTLLLCAHCWMMRCSSVNHLRDKLVMLAVRWVLRVVHRQKNPGVSLGFLAPWIEY